MILKKIRETNKKVKKNYIVNNLKENKLEVKLVNQFFNGKMDIENFPFNRLEKLTVANMKSLKKYNKAINKKYRKKKWHFEDY
jgi:hypothetical protein